jgi:hypothetical protein
MSKTKAKMAKPKNSFSSAKSLFHNKQGHLDWENTEMRDRKAEARTRTIEDLQRLPKKGNIRTLTLCGENLVHEQMLLDTTDLNGRLEELVCLEGDPSVYKAARRRLRAMPKPWQKKVTLLQAEDKQVLLATSGYKTPGTSDTPRERLRPSRGFDLIWLDWMNSFGKGIDQTVALLCENATLFSRAWNKGNPGLLYLTLACCKEEKADLKTLHLALSSFERIHGPQGPTDDLYRVRYYGLGALLNHHLQIRGVTATPTHGLFYRENKTKAMTMFFAGFQLTPTEAGKPVRFPKPEFLGVQDPQS